MLVQGWFSSCESVPGVNTRWAINVVSGLGLACWERFTTFTCVGTDSSTNTIHRADTFAWYGLQELVSKVLVDRNNHLEVELATCTGSILSQSARRLNLPLVDQWMGQNRILHVPRPQGFRFKEGIKYSMNFDGIKYSIDWSRICPLVSTATTNNSPFVPDAPHTSVEVQSSYQLRQRIQPNWVY